uniref:Uncharacterized protein n=1 Tax=Triticum urartu TaxID=4572 RepID=A0A8R7U6K0_TRIUA
MVAPACSCKKRREDEGEGERKPGGRRETRGVTAGSCAAGFSGEEQIGHGRSREWAAFGDGGAGRGARGASSQGEMDEDEDGLVRCWCGEGMGEGRLLCMLCAAGVLLLVAYYTAAFLLFVD